MLTISILSPLLGALGLAFMGGFSLRRLRLMAGAVALLPLILLIAVWAGDDGGVGFRWVEDYPWVPSLGIAWRVGIDGMSLALSLMSAVIFLAAILWPMPDLERPHAWYAWFLFLLGVTLGLFLTLDLVIFYVFFDLSLVGMYFLIGRWGHGDAQAAATKFFVYTLLGSLLILIGIIALVLSLPQMSFDMRVMIAETPIEGDGTFASFVLLAFLAGFAIKAPLFPLHTWLPPAHVDAPGPASAILAGVLLKMGTYGMIRLPLQMMPEAFARWAFALAVLAVISILWGAIVALGQGNLKRRIAYTSLNHMGYTVLGIAVAGAASGSFAAREAALTGAILEMVAHGLITGALFLMAGAIWARAQDYEMAHFGGLAADAPRMTALATLAAFASLGLPGLAGFVAELHVFLGAFGVYPWLAGIGLLGIVITAALFLQLLRAVFFGARAPLPVTFPDLSRAELSALVMLLVLVVLIGIFPAWLIEMIDAGTILKPGSAQALPTDARDG